MNQCKKNRCR